MPAPIVPTMRQVSKLDRYQLIRMQNKHILRASPTLLFRIVSTWFLDVAPLQEAEGDIAGRVKDVDVDERGAAFHFAAKSDVDDADSLV